MKLNGKQIDESTHWLEPNNIGVAIRAFIEIGRIRRDFTPTGLLHLFIDAVWH
jgi:hypothetical protein